MPRALTIATLVAVLGAAPVASQDLRRLAEQLSANVVRVKGASEGFGFVVHSSEAGVFIVTANHVIRGRALPSPATPPPTATIQYRDGGFTWLPATVLPAHHRRLDVALLRVDPPGRSDWVPDAFASGGVTVGDQVSFVGRRADWFIPVAPAFVNRVDPIEQRILFEAAAIQTGSSGAPLLSAEGIVGMIVSDEPGLSEAVPFELIAQALRGWGVEPVIGTSAVRTPARVDSTAAREAPPTWSLADTDWVRFEISNLDYLPAITDGFGSPDYRLVGSSDDGASIYLQVDVGRRARSFPRSVASLGDSESFLLEIIEDDSPFGREIVTGTRDVSMTSLIAGTRVVLPIRGGFLTSYPDIDQTRREIGFSLQLVRFDPEAQTGADGSAAGATRITTGTQVTGRVSFNAGDATDYLRFDAGVGSGHALIWLTGMGARAVTLEGGTASILADTVGVFGDTITVLAARAPAGTPLVVRVSAARPGELVDYSVEGWDGRRMSDRPSELIGEWLSADRLPAQLSIGAVVSAVSNHYGISRAALARTFEAALDRVAGRVPDAFAPPIEDRIFAIVEADLSAYSATLPAGATNLRHVVAILQASANQPVDSAVLLEALGSRSTAIVTRAIRQVEKLPQRAEAERALEPLVLDRREDVSRAAVDALRRLRGGRGARAGGPDGRPDGGSDGSPP